MMDGKKINGPRKRGGSSVLLRFAKTSIWERFFLRIRIKYMSTKKKVIWTYFGIENMDPKMTKFETKKASRSKSVGGEKDIDFLMNVKIEQRAITKSLTKSYAKNIFECGEKNRKRLSKE